MSMKPVPPDDWIAGLRLLQARNASVPELLRVALTLPIDEQEIARSIGPGGVVTTGAGSSAAHARFLASVLGELAVAARFAPLTAFLEPPAAAAADQTLVVFSQGLSPNARLALEHTGRWHSVWLATAVRTSDVAPDDTPGVNPDSNAVVGWEAAPGNDDDARRHALESAVAAGVQLLPIPAANEYGTLLRILGPMTGYAIALRFAAAAARSARTSGNRCQAPISEVANAGPSGGWLDVSADEVCRVVAGAGEKLGRLAGGLDAEALERNLVFLASGTHTERIENLRLKFLEGTLRPAPPVWDVLDLAHGPFQQLVAGRATLIALARSDATGEGSLLSRLSGMLDAGRHRLVTLTSELPGPLAIFEHEALMNELVLRYIAERRIDPCRWPGKGADGPLYSWGSSTHAVSTAIDPVSDQNAHRGSAGGDASARRTRRLEELTWPELESFLSAGGRTAILPLGSIEQHGPHLPFATDAWIAGELARRLTARLPDAIELPVLALGCACEHLAFPGTLSLDDDTLARVLCDLAASVSRHGFHRLFVFSAHGGNRDALAAALPRMRAVAGSLKILAAPGLGVSKDLFAQASARHAVTPDASGHHAGEFETSILLGIAPQHVRSEHFAPGLAAGSRELDRLFYPSLRDNAPNGTVGDPSGSVGSRAQAYLDAWVESLLEIYRRDDNW